MLSYVCGTCDRPLIGETIGEHLDRVAQRLPDADALVSVPEGARYTYRELRDRCDEVARALIAIGVQHGDRVAIWSQNCTQWVITQLATAKIGAILVNINPANRSHEFGYAMRQSGSSVLILPPGYKTSDYGALLAGVRSELDQLRSVVFLPSTSSGQAEFGTTPGYPTDLLWDQLVARAANVPMDVLTERQARTQFDEPINIQYTSGTTGLPKGATLSHHNLLNNGYFIGEACRYSERDRVCIPVPFYHCFGMVLGTLACITHGAAIVIPAPTFDPEATLSAVERERCTSLYGVPTMFIAELSLPSFSSFDLSSLRTGIMAGSPCPIEVMRRVQTEMHMPEVTICYGMTETSPVSFQTAVDDPAEKRVTTVGRVHPHVEVKIVDENGRIVPRGTPGELCTRGYVVMLGYWNDPEQTAAAIDAARYMHTGDIAVMDDEGYVNIAGRIKDIVIRGGENIYPREIEEFLYTHEAVKDVSVVGVPDVQYGEQLCAWIILHNDASVTEEDLREFCRSRIAHYKIPKYIVFVDEFPMTVTGKIQKYKIRKRSIDLLRLHAAAAIETA
jgi:fatty-acyl-CoA synthase